jgi:hypothetical protein
MTSVRYRSDIGEPIDTDSPRPLPFAAAFTRSSIELDSVEPSLRLLPSLAKPVRDDGRGVLDAEELPAPRALG